MHFSTLLVVLAASAASATPVNPRQASSSAGPSPTLLGNPQASPNPRANENFVGTLLAANSATSKYKKLSDAVASGNASYKYDFAPAANPQQTPGAGGMVVVANRINFPLVTGLEIAGATFFFAPCGLNTPHTHPRGTEFFTVATNSNIRTGFVQENGFTTEITTNLTQYQGTAFPQGSIHWQQNESCEPAVAIGALSSDDPGTSSIAQNFFVNTNGDIVHAALGYPEQVTPENFQQMKGRIAPSFVKGVQSCYKRCGIKY